MKKVFTFVFVFAFLSGGMLMAQNHWTAVQGNYDDNFKLATEIYINGELQSELHLELGAFQGDICRGSARMKNTPFGTTIVECMIFGAPGATYTLRLYDYVIDRELDYLTCTETISYNQNGYGNAMIPYKVYFTGSESTTFELPITGFGTNLEPGNYKLISSPIGAVSTEDVGSLMSNNYDLYWFNQAGDDQGNEWINMHDGGTLEVGKGYLYANSENVTLTFTGTPYTGNGTVTLAYSTTNQSVEMRGWNLIGNPFGQAVSLKGENPETGDLEDVEFYVMNDAGNELTPGDGAIDVMQGVFVKAVVDNQEVEFVPAETDKGSKVFINVLKDRGNTIDRAIVRLGEGGTLPKFMLNPENTKIYIEQGGDDYAVVSSNEDEIPVSFKAASNGTYTLNVAVQNAELDYLHLVDNLAGTDTDLLANPNYTFEANTGDYASRFTLVLRNTTGLVEHFAFFNGHNWTVSNQGEATLQVIDVTGRLVSTKTIDGTTQLDINAAPGVYMFRLVNGSDVKVQKVVVR